MRTEEKRRNSEMLWPLILIIIPCSLFAALNLEPGLHKDNTIFSGGISRTFDYYIPANLPTEVSLVLLLHGHGGDADGMTGESGTAAPFKVFMSIADTAKFICVFPDGEFSPIENNTRGWNDCRETAESNPNVDDVTFLISLIDTFSSYYSVSPKATFVAGMSNGGFMTMRLATEVPEMFGAFAAVCSSMPQTSECSAPSAPASVLFMNGTDDSIMPYSGGNMNRDTSGTRGDALSTWDAVNQWLLLNQIASTGQVDSLPDINKEDGTRVVKHSWESATNLKKVVFYEIIGGGHTEPSIIEKYSDWWQDGGLFFDGVGSQNHDVEMAHEIWNFFSALESIPSKVQRNVPVAKRTPLIRNAQGHYDLQGRRIFGSRKNTNTSILIMEDKKMVKKVIIEEF
jgi:polyhydroxybutyrate depolymerase